mmetsp:Transcript_80201/g.225113  ORF Transcript_80201/g.225113 Transcript_80201/m.225113 type:complete len:224 (+) Transcript_80201:159-830(+)
MPDELTLRRTGSRAPGQGSACRPVANRDDAPPRPPRTRTAPWRLQLRERRRHPSNRTCPGGPLSPEVLRLSPAAAPPVAASPPPSRPPTPGAASRGRGAGVGASPPTPAAQSPLPPTPGVSPEDGAEEIDAPAHRGSSAGAPLRIPAARALPPSLRPVSAGSRTSASDTPSDRAASAGSPPRPSRRRSRSATPALLRCSSRWWRPSRSLRRKRPSGAPASMAS